MKKRQNLKNNNHPQSAKQCIICKIKMANVTVIEISGKINNKKYFQPFQRRAYSQQLTHQLSFRGVIQSKVCFREADYLMNQHEYLKKYNNFRMTVASIKGVIMERVNRDFLQPVFHQMVIFSKIMDSRKARLSEGRQNDQFIQKRRGSGASTQVGQKSQKIKKINQSQLVQQIKGGSKRRLSRNLSSMFQQINENVEFHPSLISEFINYRSKHELERVDVSMDSMFKQEMQDNFSAIQFPKIAISKSYNHIFPKMQDNYGFKVRQKITEIHKSHKEYELYDNKKKLTSREQMKFIKQNIPFRAQTDYDCAVIKAKQKASKSIKQQSKQKFYKLGITSASKKKQNLKAGSLTKLRLAKKI